MNPEGNKYIKSNYRKPSSDSAATSSNSETDHPLVGGSQLFPSGSSFSSPLVEAFEFKAIDMAATATAEAPQPVASLYEHPIPPFLSKTYDLVDDRALDPIISWGEKGESFVVWDPVEFCRIVLPRNFKHNNFSSFVRQLNTYGFRKIDNDRWEFANESFKLGEKHLLKNIQRRRSPNAGPSSVESGKPELEKEIEILRKERGMMLQEVVELQKQQRGSVHHMQTVNERLHEAERRQKQMLSFLSKLFQNPAFLTCLRQNKEQGNIGSPRMKKFVKHQQHEPDQLDSPVDGQIVKYRFESKDISPEISPVPVEQSFDYNLQDMVETGEEALDLSFPIGSAPSDEFYPAKGYMETSAQFVEGPSSGEPKFKEKNVINPEQEFVYGNPISFPEDLVAEKTYPEFPSPGNESIVKQEDEWGVVFGSQASVPGSSQELWGNLVPFDVSESEISEGFSDIWDLRSAAASLGIDKWPIGEKPDDGHDGHGHPKNE